MIERPIYEASRYVTTGQKVAGVILIVPALGISLLGLILIAAGVVGAEEVLLQSKTEPFYAKGVFGGLPATLIVGVAGLVVIALASTMMMTGQIISGRKRRVKPDQLVWLVGYRAMRDTMAVLWLATLVAVLVCLLGYYLLGAICVMLVAGVAWFAMVACNRKMAEIERL